MIIKEDLTDILIDEITPLLELHRQEISAFPDMVLNIDWDKYYQLQKLKKLHVFTSRDKETNELLGYLVYICDKNSHYQDYIYALQDVFYVKKELRGRFMGVKLLKFSENNLKRLGVAAIMQHMKVDHPFQKLLVNQGYKMQEYIYSKRL